MEKIYIKHKLLGQLLKNYYNGLLENDKVELINTIEDVNSNSQDLDYTSSDYSNRRRSIPEIKASSTTIDIHKPISIENEFCQRATAFDDNDSNVHCTSTTYGTEVSDTKSSSLKSSQSSNYNYNERTPLINHEFVSNHKNNSSDTESLTGSEDSNDSSSHSTAITILQYIKIFFLCGVMLGSIGLFISVQDSKPLFMQLSVMENDPLYINLPDESSFPIVKAAFRGKFLPHYYDNVSDVDLFVTLQKIESPDVVMENMSVWRQPIAPAVTWSSAPDVIVEHEFDLQNHEVDWVEHRYRLKLTTNSRNVLPLSVSISEAPKSIEYGVIFATCILVALYIIIVFDLIHRTLAAMWAGIIAIGVLALLNEKPTLNQVMSWMDIETLALLFGMMVLVAILCETGFFDYVAVLAYRMAKGNRWTVITLLCIFTGVISAFLDNVTTILLFTPVSIRLCEVMDLHPKNVLIALVMFSNIGGTGTAVGDPPNVIIVSNSEITKKGIGFANFTMHMAPGAIIAMVAGYFLIRLMYRNLIPLKFEEPHEVVELRHEILVWKRAAGSLSLYSRDEKTVRSMLLQKVQSLETLLKKKLLDKNPQKEAYEASLLELQKKFRIRNFPLLIKTAIVMLAVILLFFLHSIPAMNISLGWIAIMGAVFLLILADISEIEHIFARVEWTTLVFFAALFAVMEALNELGLIKFIGTLTEDFIKELPKDMQLGVSIVLILWISAIASSFIDNIPFTTVMIKVVLQIAENPELNLPLQPLVWALAFGACFGGNGTLIGASANVVCAGVAEQHGYRFTFMEFFKIGFPVMLVTTTVATGYLLVCHVVFDWNS